MVPDPDDSTDDAEAANEETANDDETESVEDVTESAGGSSSERTIDYEVTDDEQTWGVLLHASSLSGLVVPFGNILGPLLIWLIKRDESRFVDESGKEALNFQLSWTILMLGALLTLVIGIGFLLVPIIAVAWLILVVLATIRASERDVYDYPLTLEFIE